ncbi:MAG: ABC transporter ATP-binding protein [Rikenellaceae bacterium]
MFKTYRKLLQFAKPIEKYAVPYFFFAILYALFNSLNYAMIAPIMSTLFDEEFTFRAQYSLPEFSFSGETFTAYLNYFYTMVFGEQFSMQMMLMLLAVVVVFMSLFSNLFRYLCAWTVENLRTRTVQNIRNQMFDKIMDMHVGYFSDQRKGDIISKITSDVSMVQFCITNTLQVAFREPFLVIGYLILMFRYSWQLSIFSIIFMPLVAIMIGSIVKRLRNPARKSQKLLGEMVSWLEESLSGVKVIKSYNATPYVKEQFKDLTEEHAVTTLKMVRSQQLASPMSEFMGVTAVGIIIVFGGGLVATGSLSAAAFLGFIAIFSQITRPVRMFIDQFANINQGIAAGERIFDILDEQSEVMDSPEAKRLESFNDKIEFRNVGFSYDNSNQVIKGISFTVNKGESVALVGTSGGGKSTIGELIPRFYDPQSGDILIDGVSMREYTQESVRALMGLVAQDTVLFNDTIMGNLSFGKQGATPAEVEDAAKVANAHDFIMQSESGYQTNIGDRGLKLSGGQRQRLSIARAVLKNPDILILDEATSALDTESEKLVQESLSTLLKGRTSIVVAHRLSTIYEADKILVIDKGQIKEQGKHSELIAKGGIYAKLVEMQSFQ